MGIINDFLKRIGFKKHEQYYLPKGDSENITPRIENKFNGEFDASLKFTPNSSSELTSKVVEDDTQDTQKNDKPVLRVFPQKYPNSNQIYYEVEMDTDDGNVIPISVIKGKRNEILLKDIVNQISEIVSSIQNNSRADNISEKQEELRKKMQMLAEKNDIVFTRNIIEKVENRNLENNTNNAINYEWLQSKLPKSIDTRKLTREEILQYGKILKERQDFLNNITTPEDAYKDKIYLESFMKYEEKLNVLGAIVAANLENLEKGEKPLDVPTILALAKKLETTQNSEDGVLYSAYLKSEENRIIRKLQQDITNYRDSLEDVPENIPTKQLSDAFIEHLETTKTSVELKGEDNVMSYMINTIQGRNIENYVKNTVKNDIRLKTFVNNNPIENGDEAYNYLMSKIACFGQVVDIPESKQYSGKIIKLRDVIENTEYKDDDDSEVKDFLYTVVQVEKDYIKKNYDPVIREFQKIVDEQTRTREDL